jgi:hypothetical protein
MEDVSWMEEDIVLEVEIVQEWKTFHGWKKTLFLKLKLCKNGRHFMDGRRRHC